MTRTSIAVSDKSSVIARADDTSAESAGQNVHNYRVVEKFTSSAYTGGLHARMRAAREACGLSQKEMAKVLGVSKDAYEKYETRSRLPHHLIEPFALITGASISFLITGHEEPRRNRQPAATDANQTGRRQPHRQDLAGAMPRPSAGGDR